MDEDTSRSLARMLAMEVLFEQDGWREIVAELEGEIEVIKGQLVNCTSWEETKFLQGRVAQCLDVIYLPDSVSNIRDMLETEEAEVINADV